MRPNTDPRLHRRTTIRISKDTNNFAFGKGRDLVQGVHVITASSSLEVPVAERLSTQQRGLLN